MPRFFQAVSCPKASSWSRLHPVNLSNGARLETGDNLTINNLGKLLKRAIQCHQLNMAVFLLYFGKGEHVYSSVHWTSLFLQGTRKTRHVYLPVEKFNYFTEGQRLER